MLWYNIVLVLYGILTYCGLNLNRLHTCASIEKLKMTKGVPQARPCRRRRQRAEPSQAKLRRGVASKRAMRVVSCRVMSCRARARVRVGFATWVAKRKGYRR
jgi:hypothetical protein